MYLRVPDPRGFVFTQAFQSIGLGLAQRRSARPIARPDRLTVACLGDGGALMALPELETLARLRLPMLVVVYNDAAYGAEVHHFGPHGHPVELVQFPDTDFAALARGRRRARRHRPRRRRPRRDRGLARVARRPAGRRCEDHARLLRGMARGGLQMTQSLAEMLSAVEVVDLTQPLSEDTPVLKLPPPFANTPGFTRHEISRYDDRGPAWAWNWLEIGEHVGTHFDAPIHWITGQDGDDVARVPPRAAGRPGGGDRQVGRGRRRPRLPADGRPHPRVRGRARPAAGGRLAAVAHRLGRPRPRRGRRSSTPTRPARTRPASTSSAPAGWPRRARSSASASRRSAPTPAPPTPSTALPGATASCSARASTASPSSPTSPPPPPTGAVVIVAPLKLVRGTGSPARVLALVPRA